MMEKLGKIGAQCYRCGSSLGTEELVKAALGLSRGEEFVQIFKYDKQIEGRLLPAYFNSLIRYGEEGMRSREISKEMLILVAGKMNISKAIGICGVKDPGDFLLFSTSKSLAKAAQKKLKLEKMERVILKFDTKMAPSVAITPIIEG